MLSPTQQAFALNLLAGELTSRRTRRDMLVKTFGDRITVAVKAEVDHLNKEIEALEIMQAMITEAPIQ